MPGGSGYVDSANGTTVLPTPDSDQGTTTTTPSETTPSSPAPQDLSLPGGSQKPAEETKPAAQPPIPPQPAAPATPEPALPKPAQTPPVTPVPGPTPNSGSYYPSTQPNDAYTLPANGSAQSPAYTMPRSYTPQRQPVFMRNASRPNNPQSQQAPARENSLIGPVGYDQ
jgi:hypothetical protein